MEVRNITGSSSRSPGCRHCGFWIYHYVTQTKQWNQQFTCSELTCQEKASAGGHVFVKNEGRIQFIIPLCAKHNNPSHTDWFQIKNVKLVRANQTECTYRGRKHGLLQKFKRMGL